MLLPSIKNRANILTAALLSLSLLFILYHIFINLEKYTVKFDAKWHEKRYLESQWRVSFSQKRISDEELYTYSGYLYVKGENPILINPEQPPLGKYIIGLFVHIFNNGRLTSIVFATALLYLIYSIIFFLTGSRFVSSLGIFITATHSLFIDQIAYAPQLDIMQVVFFLLVSLFILKFQKSNEKKYLLLTGISLGMMLSIKVFLQSFIIMAIFLLIIFYLSNKDKRQFIRQYLLVISISLFVFTLTYWSYFLHGGSLRGFLGVQKWIALFYKDSGIDKIKLFGSYIGLVLINRWRVWSEGYPLSSYHSWSITWPVYFVIGVFVSIKALISRGKKQTAMTYFSLWVILYGVSLLFVPVFPRYLLLLYVPIIILITLYVDKILTGKKIL